MTPTWAASWGYRVTPAADVVVVVAVMRHLREAAAHHRTAAGATVHGRLPTAVVSVSSSWLMSCSVMSRRHALHRQEAVALVKPVCCCLDVVFDPWSLDCGR